MNPSSDLTVIANKFTNRIDKLRSEALADNSRIDRYCIVSISQLNNFLRSYLLSIRIGARDSKGSTPSFKASYISQDLLIDEIIRYGNPCIWKAGKVGIWSQKSEPALHSPKVFLTVVNRLGCSNISAITSAMADSWKVDILRDVRNYFAHRSFSTENRAIISVKNKYVVNERAARILFENDQTLAIRVIDDIHIYLSDFAKSIC